MRRLHQGLSEHPHVWPAPLAPVSKPLRAALAAVALALVLAMPATAVHAARPTPFFLTSGHGQYFLLRVESHQAVNIAIDVNAGTVSGLHVYGGRVCSDPNVTATLPIGGTVGASSCGVMDPGAYWIQLKLDSGVVHGQLRAGGATLS